MRQEEQPDNLTSASALVTEASRPWQFQVSAGSGHEPIRKGRNQSRNAEPQSSSTAHCICLIGSGQTRGIRVFRATHALHIAGPAKPSATHSASSIKRGSLCAAVYCPQSNNAVGCVSRRRSTIATPSVRMSVSAVISLASCKRHCYILLQGYLRITTPPWTLPTDIVM